ncbi:MAG TPA: hypothetical protein VNS09_03960 [Solirubrobacter sp.]|nr:hypothetical protein [Solirubrobacter sp.]
MSRFFDDLERDLVRAAAVRARPARRPFVAFGLTAALALGVAGTAAAGTYLALRGSSIAPFAASDVTPEQRVAPGSGAVAGLHAADPDRGAPPWTLRVSRSDTGLQCSAVGQLQDGTFGIVGLDGVFRALPEANADACGEPGTLVGVRIFAAKRPRDVRTVVNGVAGPRLQRVTVAAGGGAPRTVPHTPDGAFVLALRGYPEDAQPVVTLHRKDGSERTYDFSPKSGFVVADADGDRAWRLTASALGTPGGRPLPRVRPGCLSFSTARSVPGQPGAASPLVCGLEPGRAGVKLDPLYFTTRRLSGGGRWNHHPPRVAVWGSARGRTSITVRAPGGFEQRARPRPNGGFLVFLPPDTDPGAVTVTVDGHRYGPTHGTVPPPKGLRG